MNWSIHATIVSCTVAILGAIGLAFHKLDAKQSTCATTHALLMQVHALNTKLAALEQSDAKIQKSIDDESIRAWTQR